MLRTCKVFFCIHGLFAAIGVTATRRPLGLGAHVARLFGYMSPAIGWLRMQGRAKPPTGRISHKRGDAFRYGADHVGLPVWEAWIATAQVRAPLAPDPMARSYQRLFGSTHMSPLPHPGFHPLTDDSVLLADSGFILEPDFNRRWLRHALKMRAQRAREVCLNASTISPCCAGCLGRALMWEKPSFFRSVPMYRSQ